MVERPKSDGILATRGSVLRFPFISTLPRPLIGGSVGVAAASISGLSRCRRAPALHRSRVMYAASRPRRGVPLRVDAPARPGPTQPWPTASSAPTGPAHATRVLLAAHTGGRGHVRPRPRRAAELLRVGRGSARRDGRVVLYAMSHLVVSVKRTPIATKAPLAPLIKALRVPAAQ